MYEPKHRGVPDVVVFEPGTRLRGIRHGDKRELTNHVFLVLKGGYVVEGDWNIFVTDHPLTSKDFVRIGRR